MRVLSVLCLLILLVRAEPSRAQVVAPLVVFVEEARALATASVTDNGPDGLTRLAEMFQSMGARTSWVHLDEPVPDDARVIVLVRPRQQLSPAFLARLWLPVSKGASLLVALEPPGYLGARTETSGGGLDRLLTYDHSISLLNGILLEPLFSNDSFRELFSTFSLGYADPVPNPISNPVRQYDLPIGLWGARPLRVEPFGVDSFAWALVDASPVFVETATDIFPTRTNEGAPALLNLDKDYQGIVPVAAFSENTRAGSRVAVLGDGEFLQNGYGLRVNSVTSRPLFPGNYIITQRLAAWLLGVPEDQYPPLPDGFTWIALDGSIRDWSADAPITTDDPADASILSLNIQQVRAIYNDSYLYMTIETVSQASSDARVELQVDSTGQGQAATVISMQPGRVLAQTGDQPVEQVPDADLAIGEVIELRVPLRLTGEPPRLVNVCLSSRRELAFPQPPDCMETPVQVGRLNQADPAPLRAGNLPVLAVRGDGVNRVNVRRTPEAAQNVLVTVPYGTVFAAIGRSASGEWIQVQLAAYRGWVSRMVLFADSSNLDLLPITG